MNRFSRFCIVLNLSWTTASYSDDCVTWFKKAKIKFGPNCVTQCAIVPTNMSNFTCPSQCKELCDARSAWEKILGNLAYYPGLNSKERELVTQYPNEAAKVFAQSFPAESATELHFGRDSQDDESDAFRHYVWAALLYKEIGPELAKEFLDAHEFGQIQTPNGAMDLANNRAGLLAAEKLKAGDRLNEGEIIKMALKELRDGTLVVLKPKGGPIK